MSVLLYNNICGYYSCFMCECGYDVISYSLSGPISKQPTETPEQQWSSVSLYSLRSDRAQLPNTPNIQNKKRPQSLNVLKKQTPLRSV